MTVCSACGKSVSVGSRFCGSCGEPVSPESSAPTRVNSPGRGGASGRDGAESGNGAAGSPGRRSRSRRTRRRGLYRRSSGISEGRFLPGAILLDRYRIVGPIGRGGMGEVYRADDLKLGQPVALKFLPEQVQNDPERLERLLSEVRLARQVSHPHVCRVYDVGEVDGQHFLSMEYVDGEDLASLLRRIGHLPRDKAVQLSRQICAGLAAAHDAGILHRDLKPHNIMIDGRGRARLTDFGLAALGEDLDAEETRYGTPAYMAPEQLEGQEVSERSDLYALGLVLYELFTGDTPYKAETVEELQRLRTETTPLSPSSTMENFDPAVERVILRCLETLPSNRPASALAVAAALPGGDPLAAALAAGETPSPEMVAEADDPDRMRAGTAWVVFAALLLLLPAAFFLNRRLNIVTLTTLDRPPQYLQERARDLLRELGYDREPVDRLYTLEPDPDYLEHVRENWEAGEGWSVLRNPQPPAIRFFYRQSPELLRRISDASIGAWMYDPPMTVPGMAMVVLDPEGRLDMLRVLPPERRPAAPVEPDWAPLLEAGGFDPASLTPVEPAWAPPDHADHQAAWTGVHPDAPDVPVRLEAASFDGRVSAFRIVRPWTVPAEAATDPPGFWQIVADVLNSVWFAFVLIAASWVALRNVRGGRGDSRGALRLALYLGAVRMLWMLDAHLLPSSEMIDLFTGHLAYAMYRAGLVYVFYLAVEPYARRLWPQVLVSWVRVLDGRFGDPLVGRSLLLGALAGLAVNVVSGLGAWLPEWMGGEPAAVVWDLWTLEALRGFRGTLTAVIGVHTTEMLRIIFPLTMLLVLRLLFRRTWIAVGLVSLLATPLFYAGAGSVIGYLLAMVLVYAVYWAAFFRGGLLALVVATTVMNLLDSIPLTLDPSSWYAGATVLTLLVAVAPAIFGLRSILAAVPRLSAVAERNRHVPAAP